MLHQDDHRERVVRHRLISKTFLQHLCATLSSMSSAHQEICLILTRKGSSIFLSSPQFFVLKLTTSLSQKVTIVLHNVILYVISRKSENVYGDVFGQIDTNDFPYFRVIRNVMNQLYSFPRRPRMNSSSPRRSDRWSLLHPLRIVL